MICKIKQNYNIFAQTERKFRKIITFAENNNSFSCVFYCKYFVKLCLTLY